MADHVSATLIVHALPRQGARAVMDLIKEQGLTDGMDDANGGVLPGVPYCAHDWASGTLDAIQEAMHKIPGAAWTAWYDPFEQDLGELLRFVPGLGMFACCCDSDGRPEFTDEQIRDAMALGRNQRVLVDAHYLYELIGQRWHDAIEAMSATSKPRVTPPPTYNVLWDRRTGTIEVEPEDDDSGDTIELQGPASTARIAMGDPRERAAAALRVEEFLREQGWTRTGDDWTTMARGRLWSTTAYRLADVTEVSA